MDVLTATLRAMISSVASDAAQAVALLGLDLPEVPAKIPAWTSPVPWR